MAGAGRVDDEYRAKGRSVAGGLREEVAFYVVALVAKRIDMWQNGGNAGDRDDGPEGISGLAERG